MFIEDFKTKKFVLLITLPLLVVILIRCLVLQNTEANISFFCYTGGFLCGYVPQFVFDQKTKARGIFKSMKDDFS
jgi:hypothetical protein